MHHTGRERMTKSHARWLANCHTVDSHTREGRRTCLRQAVARYLFMRAPALRQPPIQRWSRWLPIRPAAFTALHP